ncbi:hypothetical protein NOCD_19135 [Nocardioides cavernae]|uniref:NADase-type glycan-binding domain-containing protein n=1 Tax=Nocardioides cavernae TaxID=1921566 RepID=UPI00200C6791|nr:hypothetical protein [Nocardioides cavernae]MCK9825604.1 hypothetical protein [Nocardioides cavernae]
MDTCVQCGADLGVGRFCLNCGHPIGAPVPAVPHVAPSQTVVRRPAVAEPGVAEPAEKAPAPQPPAPAPEAEVSEGPPVALPVQAADPTPLPPAPVVEWDPERDLLPYHEVDELEPDAPLTGTAWMFWVGGALALVALVLVLLQVFDSDPVDDTTSEQPGSGSSAAADPDGATSDEPDDSGTSAAPQGVGKRLDLAESATFTAPATAPPTQDFDGNLVAYEAGQMGDGNPATTWRMAGDASGQSITITLAAPGVVNRVGLVNGYAKKVAGVDWYPNNRRILSATWTFDDGTSVEQTFAERPAMQRLKVPPVETSTVTLTITSVTPPGAGPLGRDYTAISEVTLIGRNAA